MCTASLHYILAPLKQMLAGNGVLLFFPEANANQKPAALVPHEGCTINILGALQKP